MTRSGWSGLFQFLSVFQNPVRVYFRSSGVPELACTELDSVFRDLALFFNESDKGPGMDPGTHSSSEIDRSRTVSGILALDPFN